MRFKQLTAALLITAFTFSACEKRNEVEGTESLNITMSGAQEAPPVTTTATGSIVGTYDKAARVFTYTVQWSGLSGPVAGMHVHGPADPGFNAGILQNIIASGSVSGGVTIANPGAAYGTSGSISGRLNVDNVKIKEAELLAGKYYINIHTAANPGGEIRGNLVFP